MTVEVEGTDNTPPVSAPLAQYPLTFIKGSWHYSESFQCPSAFHSSSLSSVTWSCDYLLESEQASPGDLWRRKARDPQQGVEERKSTTDIKEKSQRQTLTWLLQDGLTNPNFWVIWLVLNSCHLPSTRVWALISYFTKRSVLRLTGPCS